MSLAGHRHRHYELPASQLVPWDPTQDTKHGGGHKKAFIGVLKRDTGAESVHELASCTDDPDDWLI